MNEATPTVEEHHARERLTQSLKQMVDEADHLLKNAQRTGNEQFDAARARFESQLRHARAELDDLQADAVARAKRAARNADHAVHEHPWAAMGIAAGAALLLGMLISRR